VGFGGAAGDIILKNGGGQDARATVVRAFGERSTELTPKSQPSCILPGTITCKTMD